MLVYEKPVGRVTSLLGFIDLRELLSPGCRRISRPTARAPPAPHVTSALKTRSPHSSPPPTARLACHLGASWSHQDAPRFALGRKRGLPPRARLPPRSWLAPTG